MRLVVSDTGPINYLVLIGHIDILRVLFTSVLMPVAVRNELLDVGAPAGVRTWMSDPPAWLEVREVPPTLLDQDSLAFLDDGEREAVALAAALPADTLLLIDERTAVKAARGRGLAVTGTIGILEEAARQGLLDLADAFDCLRRTSFYLSESLLQRILAQQRREKDSAQ